MVDSMNVRLYPNLSKDDSLISDARNGIDTAFQQTVNYFSDNGENLRYSIEVDKAHPDVKKSAPFFKNNTAIAEEGFGAWLAANGRDQTAVHLLLSSDLTGGIGAGVLGGAWRNDPAAVVGSKNTGTTEFKSLCIHETYHLFLNIGIFLANGSPNNEHKLGTVISSESGPKQTPMINGYLDTDLPSKGECSGTANSAEYTTTLSDCTLNKTLYSYRNQGRAI